VVSLRDIAGAPVRTRVCQSAGRYGQLNIPLVLEDILSMSGTIGEAWEDRMWARTIGSCKVYGPSLGETRKDGVHYSDPGRLVRGNAD